METWGKPLHRDWYGPLDVEVSSLGRVRRGELEYVTTGRWGTPHTSRKPARILSQCKASNGYMEVAIQNCGRRQKFRVHRLVASVFVPGWQPGLTVNHINGDKTDNRAENLEWVTRSRNTQHQWETGMVNLRGDRHPSRKLSSGQVRIIRSLLQRGATAGELATLAGVSTSTVYLIRAGKRWSDV